jgi:histidinol-phosphate/aromatic aminotransferase/cobyric acid decarboxylase-like protein
MALARPVGSRYVLSLKGVHDMGKSRYDKPIIPFTSNETPYDLSDPVEALIASAMEKFKKVDYFPEPTAENFVNFISLRKCRARALPNSATHE